MTVRFINVNYEKGAEILKRCKAMEGYSLLIHMIREECEATGELKTAIESCIRKCVEEGEAAGFEKGEASGFEKGETQGELSGKLKVARAMKARGMTIDEICEITGLKPDQVEEL